jgi:hypothetical protein
MSRDSRQLDDPSDRFVEQLSVADAGMRLQPSKVDWAGIVAQRRTRRRVNRTIAGAVVVICLVLPGVWYANRPASPPKNGIGGPEFVEHEATAPAAAKQELVEMDRELSQLNRQIASLQRKDRSRKANLKTAALLKATPPTKTDFSDPIEEGALVMLVAAEKAAQKDGKEAGLALYRRVVEIFPESRSAEIARRELM